MFCAIALLCLLSTPPQGPSPPAPQVLHWQDGPNVRTIELFYEDYAGKTLKYPVWVNAEGIGRNKDIFVLQFRDAWFSPPEAAPRIGATSIRTDRLNFVLTREQAKKLCEETASRLSDYPAYEMTFTIQREQVAGGYPIATIIDLKAKKE
jgi:hypothetical protein